MLLDGGGLVLDLLGVTNPREVLVRRPYEAALEGVAVGGDRYRRILAELRPRRNHARGFWVAKDDLRAAAEAVTVLNDAVLLSTALRAARRGEPDHGPVRADRRTGRR